MPTDGITEPRNAVFGHLPSVLVRTFETARDWIYSYEAQDCLNADLRLRSLPEEIETVLKTRRYLSRESPQLA